MPIPIIFLKWLYFNSDLFTIVLSSSDMNGTHIKLHPARRGIFTDIIVITSENCCIDRGIWWQGGESKF